MREILFRAKRLENDETYEWVEGMLCYNIYEQLCIQPIGSSFCTVIDPETVCQFTGMCDKNNKKIYENDICIEDEYTYLVQYDDEWGFFKLVEYAMSGSYTENGWDETGGVFEEVDELGLINYIKLNAWFDVIGNKFDNPELLDR